MPFGDLFKSNCKLCKECASSLGETFFYNTTGVEDLTREIYVKLNKNIYKCKEKCQKCARSGSKEDRLYATGVVGSLTDELNSNADIIQGMRDNENPPPVASAKELDAVHERFAREDWESQQRRQTTPVRGGKKPEEELDPIELAAAKLKWANDWNDAPDPSAAAAAPREESRLLEPWAYAIVERWKKGDGSKRLKDKLFEEYADISTKPTRTDFELLLKTYGS